LLRLYGGVLFSTLSNISVQHIAQFLNATPKGVAKQLETLEQWQIIQYRPHKDTPQITFIAPRYPAALIPLDSKKLKQRMTIAKEKAKAVVHYITCQYRCRVHLLLEYFSEIVYPKCGQCDVCLVEEKQRSQHPAENYQKYRLLVLKRLKQGKQELKEIMGSVDLIEEEAMLVTIRKMLDNGEVAYDNAYRLMPISSLEPGRQNNNEDATSG